MKLGILLLVTGLLVTNAFGGPDGFSGVQCNSDIAKALTGKRMSNESVADLEKRHADLGLKDLGTCEMNGKESKDIVVAILDNEKEPAASALTAKVAWKIDQKEMKFVTVPVEDLRCPRSGVITLDGGL